MENNEYAETKGRTTIDPGVLIEIARLTALGIDGVADVAPGPQPVNSLLSKSSANGIKIEVENNTVYVDLYLVLSDGADLYKTGQVVQEKVARAIKEMVGMDVGNINIHIEDIQFA